MVVLTPALGALHAHPVEHPHRLVRLASFARLPESPPAVDWTGPVSDWGLYQNDRVGDCTVVAPANVVRLWTAHQGRQRDLAEQTVLDAYTSVSGYDPADPTSDRGAIVSDALALWHARGPGGIGDDVLDGFAEVEHSDRQAIKQCVATFGACILRVDLPLSAQGADEWAEVGDVAGSWGLHCVACCGYDAGGTTVITWGRAMRASWAWLAYYVGEAWAPVSRDWLMRDGRSPSGLDLGGLLAAREALRDRT